MGVGSTLESLVLLCNKRGRAWPPLWRNPRRAFSTLGWSHTESWYGKQAQGVHATHTHTDTGIRVSLINT